MVLIDLSQPRASFYISSRPSPLIIPSKRLLCSLVLWEKHSKPPSRPTYPSRKSA
jgi:hypothetical protein